MAIKLGTDNDDNLFGTSSNDVIFGYTGTDILLGKAGNDVLNADNSYATVVYGDEGDDYIVAENADSIKIDAGDGNDIVVASAFSGGTGGIKDTPAGTSLLDTSGGNGDDYLFFAMSGGYEFDFTMGSGLNTTLYTGTKISGFETGIIIGGELRDHFTANSWTLDAADFAIQSSFASYDAQITDTSLQTEVDKIGQSLTLLTQYQGFFGGGGGDDISVSLDANTKAISRGVLLSGGTGSDNIDLSLSRNAISALMANKGLFKVDDGTGVLTDAPALLIDAGEDYFNSDIDTFVLTVPSTILQSITLTQANVLKASGRLLAKIQGVENYELHLGAGPDNVTTTGSAVIEGFAGDDKITTGHGANTITGGLGADTIIGGGYDTVLYSHVSTINIAHPNLGAGEAKGDELVSIERFQLSDENDTFIGSLRGEEVFGGGGNDKLVGGNNTLSGNDILDGGDGDDILNGGSEDDTLTGDAGNDILTGESGSDTFRFTSPTADGIDKLTDFEHGVDKIAIDSASSHFSLLDIILNPDAANPPPIEFWEYEPTFFFDDGTGALSFDYDGVAGNAPAVQFATLVGVKTLSTSDFETYY